VKFTTASIISSPLTNLCSCYCHVFEYSFCKVV